MRYWAIEDMAGFFDVLQYIKDNGDKVVVRGEAYREIRGVAIIVPPFPDVDALEAEAPNFSLYLAMARAECVIATSDKAINNAIARIHHDKTTRQAYMIKPDWYWEGHEPCVMAMQIMIRNTKPRGYVFMRSSDFYNAFLYDWITCGQILANVSKSTVPDDTKLGPLTFMISNLHIREQDVGKI